MIRKNIIHSFPVTVEDIDVAEKIFGPDVSILNVTKTINRSEVVVDGFIEVPRELIENKQELILCNTLCSSINRCCS